MVGNDAARKIWLGPAARRVIVVQLEAELPGRVDRGIVDLYLIGLRPGMRPKKR